MTNNPWYSFYVGDYARKTAHLSLLEHGAYRLLLDHYYATRSPLPSDPAKLTRICRARSPSERKAVLSVVAEFFTQDGTLLRNNKCDSEIDKLLKFSNRQSAAAKLRHCGGKATAKPRTRVPQPQPQDSVAEATSSIPTPLPDWMPVELWEGFMEVRKKKRAVPTARAIALIIAKLERWRAKGHDPSAILEKSITSNYTDVFEPKGSNNENTGRNFNGRAGNGNQQGGAGHHEQQPSKWQVAGARVLDKIARGEI